MIYITDIPSILVGDKINPDAKDVLSKLKEKDRLVILTEDGNLTMNTETFRLFAGCGDKIAVEKCANVTMSVFVIGKYSGLSDSIRIMSKNSDLIKSLDFLKGNDSVSFGWKSGAKKKTVTERKPRVSKKDKETDDSFMKFEEPKEETPAKEKKKTSAKGAGSSDFLELPIESVLGIDCSHLYKAGIHQVKDLYVFDRGRKHWAEIVTPEGYDLICSKLTAFGQPSLRGYK